MQSDVGGYERPPGVSKQLLLEVWADGGVARAIIGGRGGDESGVWSECDWTEFDWPALRRRVPVCVFFGAQARRWNGGRSTGRLLARREQRVARWCSSGLSWLRAAARPSHGGWAVGRSRSGRWWLGWIRDCGRAELRAVR